MAKAFVHWNLHKQIYSVRVGRDPVFNASAVHMADCDFVIVARLRRLFEEKPSRRTVHALVKGDLLGCDVVPATIGGESVRCNPFLFQSFVRASDGSRANHADEVVLHADRRIEARGLR